MSGYVDLRATNFAPGGSALAALQLSHKGTTEYLSKSRHVPFEAYLGLHSVDLPDCQSTACKRGNQHCKIQQAFFRLCSTHMGACQACTACNVPIPVIFKVGKATQGVQRQLNAADYTHTTVCLTRTGKATTAAEQVYRLHAMWLPGHGDRAHPTCISSCTHKRCGYVHYNMGDIIY